MLFLLACGPSVIHSSPELPSDQHDSSEQVDTASEWVEAEENQSDSPDGSEAIEEDVCSSDGVWPDPFWPVEPPQNHGFDPALLDAAADYAADNYSDCMVVIRNGAIVGEWYWRGTTSYDRVKSWSVGKSYASTVVGLALDRGDISSVNDTLGEYVPELETDPKGTIPIHNMLAMTAGVRLDLVEDNLIMAYAKDMTERALENPLVTHPGARWEYNNHTVQLSEPLVRNATGMAPHELAEEALWGPLGMDARWEQDDHGHTAMFMNVRASCRDHARFAYLFLREGCWKGEQVVSKDWVRKATTASSPQNQGYGYWWWLNGNAPVLDSVTLETHPQGKLHPQAPDDAFCAVGLGSQMLEVIPSLDLVIARFGPAPHENFALLDGNNGMMNALEEDGKQIVHNGILTRVLDALVDP